MEQECIIINYYLFLIKLISMHIAKIKVGIRLRPFLQSQIQHGYSNTHISADDNKKQISVKLDDHQNNNKIFQFDYIFNQKCKQDQVFHGSGIDHLVQKAIEGYHSTIFAYGQTGSGKTFSMQGGQQQISEDSMKTSQAGIIPRVIHTLFHKIKLKSIQKTFTVYVSYLQIYNEKIFDLLNPSSLNPKTLGTNVGGLKLRWNKNQQFTVENLYIFQCKNAEELVKYFNFGLKNRITSAHKLNMTSSRSHTIFSIRVQSFDHKNPNQILTSKIELVDLAGSQRIGLTGTQGKLAKQSIDINKSLFTLRQVITTLAQWNKNKTKQQVHIPYRDAKLTSILKQSIGGNSYCLMIACITPNDNFLDQNISTLNYATKATMITNRPVINDDPRNKLIIELKVQVKQLHQQLIKANKHIEIISNNKLQLRQQISKISSTKDVDQGKQMPLFRKKISQKINSNNYDQYSDRLVQSINMVRELLKSNKDLREQLDIQKRKNQQKDVSIYDLEKQNQQLRQKLNQLTTQPGSTQQSKKKIQKSKNQINNISIYTDAFYSTNQKINPTINKFFNSSNDPNTFNSFEMNQFYLNQTGMDSMPTNFNKRQINTAHGQRKPAITNGQRYRNIFTSTSTTNKRVPAHTLFSSIQKRLSTKQKKNHQYY